MSERYDSATVAEAPEMLLDYLRINLNRGDDNGSPVIGDVTFTMSGVTDRALARATVIEAVTQKIGGANEVEFRAETFGGILDGRLSGTYSVKVSPDHVLDPGSSCPMVGRPPLRAVSGHPGSTPGSSVNHDRVPGHVPSSMARNSIAQGLREAAAAESAKRAERLVGFAQWLAVILSALALAMVVSAALMGCSSAQIATAESDIHAAHLVADKAVAAAEGHPELVQAALDAVAKLDDHSTTLTLAVNDVKAAVNTQDLAAARKAIAVGLAVSAPKAAGQ